MTYTAILLVLVHLQRTKMHLAMRDNSQTLLEKVV